VRRPGVVLTIAIAWVGVVAGHLAAYLLTYPSQSVRHVHLALTGHSWLGLARGSLLAVVPVIVLAVAVRALRAGDRVTGPALVVRLAAIQVPAFALIEVMERRSLAGAGTDPAVFVGLVLQIVLAVAGAWLVDLLARAVRAVARMLEVSRPRPRSSPAPALDRLPPRFRLLLPTGRRAPPVLA
jgi:hypothetical protein